ncbi:MAG: TIGR03435 family protein [Bryobacteraceae bacterium]|jgi:uncharacterized protein (TIGR03435 family)
MRKLILAFAFATAVFGQTGPTFDVASIKPAVPPGMPDRMSGKFRVGMNIDGARVDIGFMSLADLIRIAYRVKPYQITGPNWMSSERWDIQATLPDGASRDQVPEMLQALLVERFGLKVHRENKEHAVYALIVGKNGPKLKESEPDAHASASAGSNQVSVNRDDKGVVVTGGRAGNTRMSMGPGGTMHMEAAGMTMAQLTEMLSGFVDRPVVDMTDLKGNYQVAMDVSREDLVNVARRAGVMMTPGGLGGDPGKPPEETASDPSGSSIFEAIQQLGLKLDPRKAPLDIIVVDHLEKAPTEN